MGVLRRATADDKDCRVAPGPAAQGMVCCHAIHGEVSFAESCAAWAFLGVRHTIRIILDQRDTEQAIDRQRSRLCRVHPRPVQLKPAQGAPLPTAEINKTSACRLIIMAGRGGAAAFVRVRPTEQGNRSPDRSRFFKIALTSISMAKLNCRAILHLRGGISIPSFRDTEAFRCRIC